MDCADGTERENSGQQSMSEQRHSFEQRTTPQQPIDTSERKKKINRATSPARPKEGPGWSLTKIRGGLGTPALCIKPGATHLGSRVSRRSPGGENDSKPAHISLSRKSPFSVSCSQKGYSKSLKSVRRKMSDASICSDDASKDSGFAPGKLSPTDSSSDLSDCVSEDNRLSTEATNHTNSIKGLDEEKSSTGCSFRQSDRVSRPTKASGGKDRFSLGPETSEGSLSPGDERSVTSSDSRVPASTSLAFSDLTEEFVDSFQEEFVREIEELRSENDYLKDEIEELRSEMLEMRDMYLEEEVYQFQEIRQQLEQANKACRILQYRLRKTERRSLHVAQTGQVDGELVRTLEQDIKVAKDVSIRLHSELDIVEKKRGRLEQENKELRVRTQDLEVAKQVLQQELDKNFQKKRGARPSNKSDKKPFLQEDSSDLKCQLHFAKEEAALMCKKLTKLVKDSETMKEDLAKYRSLYGDVDESLTVEEVAGSPHTREAEVKVHLKLVEEEANLLSRRIVELEVENRGLRAEMDDMKGQDQSGGSCGIGAVLGVGGALAFGGASSENVMELQRHLQFVEEEAELLRRSLIEMEEHNKLLMNEMNSYKSELPPSSITSNSLLFVDGMLNDSLSVSIQEGPVLISTDHLPKEEELRAMRLQIGELNGKVKNLQYENRVLLSHLQRCDLASYQKHSSSSASSTSLHPFLNIDAEAGDLAECPIPSPTFCEGPIGDEKVRLEVWERKRKFEETMASLPTFLGMKDHTALLAMRDQACLVTTSIQLLTSPEFNCLFSPTPIIPSINHRDEATDGCDVEKPQPIVSSLADLVGTLTSKLHTLQTQLQAFVEQVDNLENCSETERHRIEQASPLPLQSDSLGFAMTGSPVSASCAGDNQLHKEGQIPEQQMIQEKDLHALVLQDLQFQSSQCCMNEKSWGQEHALLVEESQHLKQTLLLLSLKLRCFLKHWRLGRKMEVEGENLLEVNNLKDLYLLLEEDGLTSSSHQNKNMAAAEKLTLSPNIKSSDMTATLANLKAALHDLSSELHQERQGSHELTQQFAKAKASWEVERTELKSFIIQLECKTGKETVSACKDMEVALKRDREEHQHLLADSYAAVMDLTKQLQIGECNWSREKLELLERFSRERGQWEQGLREGTKARIDHLDGDMSQDTITNGTLSRTKSTSSDSELADLPGALPVHQGQKVSGTANEKHEGLFTAQSDPLGCSDLNYLTRKNWTYLTNMQELGDSGKTWDGRGGHSQNPRMELGLDSIKKSYTAPDRTSIRIYYSPPTVRRIGSGRGHGAMEKPQALHGHPSLVMTESGSLLGGGMQNSSSICPSSSSPYEQWLSSLSTQHQELLENRGSARSISSGNGVIVASSAFHSLEISANLSDDMKEMTNCVRQAIQSSSVERKVSASNKESSESLMAIGMANHSTQTITEYVSIGLQTDTPSRGSGAQSKAWLSRPSSSSISSLASARSRQISSSLDKVHSRIDRPCCSPKYGSPKLQRRVSSVSTSRLEGSSRERSLWSLQSRGGGGGSAWARSTTTRDSPVLSGLNDGLSSLFSVVENSGSVESLVRGYGAIPSQGASPARQPPAAGKPSGATTGTEFQDFLRNECGGHAQGGSILPGERLQSEGLGLSELEVDEPKTDNLSGVVGLAGIGVNDSVHRIVHKRFMRHPAREESAVIGGKEHSNPRELHTSSITEDASCDRGSQSLTSSLTRPSRSTTRPPLGHSTHRTQESPGVTEERADPCTE